MSSAGCRVGSPVSVDAELRVAKPFRTTILTQRLPVRLKCGLLDCGLRLSRLPKRRYGKRSGERSKSEKLPASIKKPLCWHCSPRSRYGFSFFGEGRRPRCSTQVDQIPSINGAALALAVIHIFTPRAIPASVGLVSAERQLIRYQLGRSLALPSPTVGTRSS